MVLPTVQSLYAQELIGLRPLNTWKILVALTICLCDASLVIV